MATKRGKRSGTKTRDKQRGKAAPAKPAARAKDRPAGGRPSDSGRAAKGPAAAAERRVTVPAVAPARREAAPPSLLEQAKALRDAVQRSKLMARDPWGYAPKARGWQERAEKLLDQITANVDAAATRKGVAALRTEIESDRDFQEAHRRT